MGLINLFFDLEGIKTFKRPNAFFILRKRKMVYHFTWRSWASIIIGTLLIAIGGIPFAFDMGWIGFSIPLLPAFIIRILLIIGGILLLWDASQEVWRSPPFMWMSLGFGAPIIILGLIPLLYDAGILPFTLDFAGTTFLNILTAAAGVVLFIDAWKAV